MSELSNFRVRGLFVLVEPHEKEEKIGSIIIPENYQVRPPEGVVLKVGAGEYRRNSADGAYHVKVLPEIKIGDRIIYATHTNRFGAIPIELDGKKLWLIDERDILMVVEEVWCEKHI